MKRLLVVTLLIFSIIGNNCFAEDVITLDKGAVAPFKGYLFPEDKALKFRKELIELDGLRALELSYQKSIDTYKENEDLQNFKVNTLLEQNDKLSDALYKSSDRNAWADRFWFIMGVGVTGLAVYGASQLRK